MQLGLGQAANEILDFRHSFSLAGQQVSESESRRVSMREVARDPRSQNSRDRGHPQLVLRR